MTTFDPDRDQGEKTLRAGLWIVELLAGHVPNSRSFGISRRARLCRNPRYPDLNKWLGGAREKVIDNAVEELIQEVEAGVNLIGIFRPEGDGLAAFGDRAVDVSFVVQSGAQVFRGPRRTSDRGR